MNICFVANFNKTFFFSAVAEIVKSSCKANIYWVVVNESDAEFLSQDWPESCILKLHRNSVLGECEPVGEYKLNELVYGDRVLRYEKDWPKPYLVGIQKKFYDFIADNKISYCFGEVTWAHEILFHRILEGRPELNCRYLTPHTVRIPNKRFAFFSDEYQSNIVQCDFGSNEESIGRRIEIEKPDYLKLNDRLVAKSRGVGSRLKKVFRYVSGKSLRPNDPTSYSSIAPYTYIKIAEEINKELIRLVSFDSFSSHRDSPFVFIPLHKQPEASVDVIGRYYEDQYRNVLDIWRVLPDGWKILVKEHSNAIGDRSYFFYRKLMKLSGVVLIKPSDDSWEIIKLAKLVVTVSGTAAYEAALMGVPSLTFGPCFFNAFPGCDRLTVEKLRNTSSLYEIIPDVNERDQSEVAEMIMRNTFSGVISDPVSNPAVMDEDNLRNVAVAFLTLFNEC